MLSAQLCPIVCNPMDCSPSGSSVHGDSPGENTGVGCCALLQGIFPTRGLNSGLPHCRWILYQLRHKGSTVMLAPTQYSKLHTFWKQKVLFDIHIHSWIHHLNRLLTYLSSQKIPVLFVHFLLLFPSNPGSPWSVFFFFQFCFQFIECYSNGVI